MEKLGKEEVANAAGQKVQQASFNSIYMMADSGAVVQRRRSASWQACAA